MVKDYCYASLFDKKDLPYLYRYAQKVRETHDQKLVDNFNNMCESKWNDNNSTLEIGNKIIEPIDVSKTDDIVVNGGLQQCMNQIIGLSPDRWSFMGIGTDSTAPNVINAALGVEVLPRVDMSLLGWREYASASLRFAGIFGDSTASITIRECGVFTFAGLGQLMLNRNVFATALSHTILGDSFVISCVIEFVPVV